MTTRARAGTAPRRAGGRRRAARTRPARLRQRLIVLEWMLRLFEVDSLDDLLDLLKHLDAEGIGEDGITNFHRRLVARFERKHLSHSQLLQYDERIVRFWREITTPVERRGHTLKHFQYLGLLFTEVYLDRYFRDRGALRDSLNRFLEEWNDAREPGDRVERFGDDDLNKLAYWMATGSGKTLLMHVNIKQYLYYLEHHGRRRDLNRIILLTPNEGLSQQHLREFGQSGIEAALFEKETRTLFSGNTVEIIEVTKLAEDAGQKTVAVDAFEGNNLVLVDEGHRGSSSEIGAWMTRRGQLCERGFSFEYSATFGQAIKPGSSLLDQYSKAILFDYSYRYFYRDGYGKEHRILNLKEQRDEEQRQLYLTGCLLAFLQQLRAFDNDRAAIAPYGIEKPLWVFVGARVTKGTTGEELSDILSVLAFLDEFLGDRAKAVGRIETLRAGSPGLVDSRNREVFANRFTSLFRYRAADDVYDEALRLIFNAPGGGALHLDQISGAEGEIELRVGTNDPFGVVNVGNPANVIKQAEAQGIETGSGREFGGSPFQALDKPDSTVNVLIGAKKFIEGWSSWRVSTMGLMNVGKNEGSQIIQLFGRGVRLKGYEFSLKRSRFVQRNDGERHPHAVLDELEALNVFGVRANYMQQFKEYLEEEGVPTDEDMEEIVLRVINRLEPGGTFEGVELLTLKLPTEADFKRQGPKPVLDGDVPKGILDAPIVLDWYPRLQSRTSIQREAGGGSAEKPNEGKLVAEQRALLDFDAVWFELERFKAERSWHNMAIARDAPRTLLERADWYRLYIPPVELEPDGWDRVRVWQEVAVALLKKYCERYYRLRQSDWEEGRLEYERLQPDDGNFFAEYTVRVSQTDTELIDELEGLRGEIDSGDVRDHHRGVFTALSWDRHLYVPVFAATGGGVEIRPTALNAGERRFVEELREFCSTHASDLEGWSIYLLRNRSRGKGVGFFEEGGFYPDFLLWVNTETLQHLAFIDPHGLIHARGDEDRKIRFAERVKEHETRLARSDVRLDSFLFSETPYQAISWWGHTQDELETKHVLFRNSTPQRAMKKMFELMGMLRAG
jgi:hypothetical protein